MAAGGRERPSFSFVRSGRGSRSNCSSSSRSREERAGGASFRKEPGTGVARGLRVCMVGALVGTRRVEGFPGLDCNDEGRGLVSICLVSFSARLRERFVFVSLCVVVC